MRLSVPKWDVVGQIHAIPVITIGPSGDDITSSSLTVKVVEPIPGDWEMLSGTRPHTKVTSNTAVRNVTVPAERNADPSYRVRVKF
jgi:hypothetical protein